MKHKAINIRGTNGSGKSHLVRSFMKEFGYESIREPNRFDLMDIGGKIEANKIDYKGAPTYTIGSYETLSGGCDFLKNQGIDAIEQIVLKYCAKGHTIFEGFGLTKSFTRWHGVSQKIGGTIWAVMDTPLEICFERIYKRNAGKEINRSEVRGAFLTTLSVAKRAVTVGETVVSVDHENALADLCRLLGGKAIKRLSVQDIEAVQRIYKIK